MSYVSGPRMGTSQLGTDDFSESRRLSVDGKIGAVDDGRPTSLLEAREMRLAAEAMKDAEALQPQDAEAITQEVKDEATAKVTVATTSNDSAREAMRAILQERYSEGYRYF